MSISFFHTSVSERLSIDGERSTILHLSLSLSLLYSLSYTLSLPISHTHISAAVIQSVIEQRWRFLAGSKKEERQQLVSVRQTR